MAEETTTTPQSEEPKPATGEAAQAPAPAEKPAEAAAATAAVEPPPTQELPAKQPRKLPSGQQWWWGTGRRKNAVARVRLRPGEGKFTVNGREVDKYFTEVRDRNDVWAPLEKTNTRGRVDVHVNVKGGGYMGQAGAIVLGLGRALKEYDPSLDAVLRDNDFLTRDSREVERKKPGQKGARARFQFSKR